MSKFYNLPSPWNPGYDVPKYVLAEPVARGTFTTKQLPRKTISSVPAPVSPWKSGYAVPAYVQKETLGQGVFTTKWLPRRTIGPVTPNFLTKRLHALDGDSLGAAEWSANSKDPIAEFGQKVASFLMTKVRGLPVKDRKAALRVVFDEIDPSLWETVATKAGALEKSYSPKEALKRAIAASFANGLAEDLARIGQGKAPKGYVKLASGPQALSGLWDWVKKGARASVLPFTWSFEAAAAVGNKIDWSKVGSFGSSVLSAIGGLACKALNNPAAGLAAGGASAAMGAGPQAGMIGAQAAQSACSSSAAPASAPVPQPTTPSWLLPAAIGGGALLIYLAVK